jgi:hypothetical protein
MATIINASTSAGLIQTADTSGTLQLQSNGTTAAFVDTNANLNVSNSLNAPNTFGFKNRIINGAMVISQRGTSFSISSAGYTLDRWQVYGSGASVAVAQITGPTGYKNALQVTGAASVTQAGAFQRIESLNVTDLSGQIVTISANIVASTAQTFLWQLLSANATDNFSATTVIAFGTWSVTTSPSIYTATTSALPSSALNGLQLSIYPNNGGAFTSGTFSFTGVQLEKGSTATSFDYRPYGTELQLCQRYYEVGSFVSMTTIGNPYPTIYYKVTKRASATVSNSRSLTVGIIDGVNGWYQNSNDSVASFCIFTSLAEL